MVLNSKDACNLALELAKEQGCEYAEVQYVQRAMDQFVLKNGNPEIGGFIRASGLGLRVLINGAMGFCSLNDLSKPTIKQNVLEAVKLAQSCNRLRTNKIEFSQEKVVKDKYSVSAKESGVDLHPEDKASKLNEIDKIMGSKGIPFRVAMLMDSLDNKYYINSDGSEIEATIPRLMLFGVITAIDRTTGGMEQSMIQKGATGGYEWLDKWNIYQEIEREIDTLQKIASCTYKPPKETVDFIIGPNVAGIIAHENCGHPSEGDRILGREAAQAGESYLNVDKLGEQIGSQFVSIIDDPTMAGNFGYYLYDDEGVKARPRYLMKNGVFNEMLHNRESAKTMSTHSTGAARSSNFNREPIPRMSCTYIAPGDYTFEELVEDVKLGIYMVNFSEWNIDDRRYQSKYVGKECYLIKDGEITSQLIKRPPLETTTPDLFSAMDGSTKDGLEFDAATCGKGDPMQGVPVWTGGPKGTRIRNIRLS